MKNTPSADSVAQYLKDNTDFFEQHNELLAELSMPHPHGGRAISITERQVIALRDKVRALESKLSELIRFGEENDSIGERVHRLSIALIKAADWASASRVITRHLVEDFEVPHVVMRLWGMKGEGAEFEAIDDAARAQITTLQSPYCGAADQRESAKWFGEDIEHVRSLVEIPLRRGADMIGVLVLGSEEPQRFYSGMGTLFLSQIGNIAAAACARTLG